ncbi:MAG: YdcH family protein [Pseudomonadota bacterium]
MPLENHSLINEFPEMREHIHQMKTSNNHFARLFAEYDAVEHDVHRIESGAEAASDERLEGLKKQRLHLKDELFGLLKKAA